MKSVYTKYLFWLLFLAASLCFTGCENGDRAEGGGEGSSGEAGTTEVVFKMKVPVPHVPTRTLTPEEEDQVRNIDVLVFDNASGHYLYHSYGYSNIVQEGNRVEFRVALRVLKNIDRYDFWILANSRGKINELMGDDVPVDKTGWQQALVETSPAETGWIADPANNGYRPMPMWGEICDREISETSEYQVSVTRMNVKIDLEITDTDFTMSEVYLYNYYTSGYTVPIQDETYWSEGQASAPSLKEEWSAVSDPVRYKAAGDVKSFKGEIYTFEAPHGSLEDYMGNSCLVVRGTWHGIAGWYRIDFCNTDPETLQTSYLNLLRNHRYTVKISQISGPGYNDAQTAFESRPVNIGVTVIGWNEGGLNEITSDGQYQLSVDKSELTFGLESGNLPLHIYTDQPAGWAISEAEDWITVTPSDDKSGNTVLAEVSVEKAGQGRTGTFTVTAGRIRKIITVTQSEYGGGVIIEVLPSTLIFRATGMPKTVTVTTYPTNLARFMSSTGDVVWASGYAPEDHGGTGAASSFVFKPTDNASGKILNGFVTVWVEYEGQLVPQTITVRQLATDMLFNVTDEVYPPAAGTYSFMVMSDLPWYFNTTAESDPIGMITLTDQGNHPANDNGAPYTFTLSGNMGYLPRKASLIPGSADDGFSAPWVEITQNGTPPFVRFDNLPEENPTLNLEVSGAVREVMLSTNATQWKYETTGQFANIVKSASPVAGTFEGSNAASGATDTKEITLRLTPYALGENPKTPLAAGTALTGSMIFSTLVGGGAEDVSGQTITLRGVVPARWENLQWSLDENADIPVSNQIGVTASTNADWQVSDDIDGSSPRSMAKAAYGSRTMIYTVAPNNSWKDRTVTLRAFSEGFSAQSRSFVQKPGNLVELIVTEPTGSEPTLDFVQAATAQSVKIRTNAEKWKFTTDEGYNKIVRSSGIHAANTEYDGPADASKYATPEIVFTPYEPTDDVVNTAAAGTVLEGKAIFSTVTVLGKTKAGADVVREVKLNRTVPARWSVTSWNTNNNASLANTGADVSVTAATNAAWTLKGSVSAGAAGTDRSEVAQVYGTRSLSYGVPAYTGYTSRTITLTAASAGKTAETRTFTQAGYPLVFGVTSPTGTTPAVAFGSTAAAQSISMSTNATHWKYTTGGNYAQVVKSAGASANTNLAGASDASKTVTPSLSLTPYSSGDTPQTGWSAAGATVSGTVTLSSAVGVSGVTEISKAVTVSRTMPAYWGTVSWNNSTLSQGGFTVTATVPTNAAWTLSGNDGGSSKSLAADTYASRSLSYAVAPNTTWANRTITMTASSTGFTSQTKTYSQPGYAPTFTRSGSGNIAVTGGTITVNLGGSYPSDMQMRVMSGSTTVVAADPVGTSGSKSFTIPNSNQWTTRPLTVQYNKNGTWTSAIADVTQNAYSATFTRSGSGNITQEGGTLSVNVSGTVASFNMRVVVDGTSTVVSSIVQGTTGVRNITIYGNTSGVGRTLRVQYQQGTSGSWYNVTSFTAVQYGFSFASGVTVPATGGNAQITVTGNRPTIYLKEYAYNATTIITVPAGTSTQTFNLPILFNGSGASRTKTLEWSYSSDMSSSKHTSNLIAQNGDTRLTSNGTYVAASDAGSSLSWAQAMGISTSYNSSMWNGGDTYTPTTSNGCGGYSESGYPAKSWRLGTFSDYSGWKAIPVGEFFYWLNDEGPGYNQASHGYKDSTTSSYSAFTHTKSSVRDALYNNPIRARCFRTCTECVK